MVKTIENYVLEREIGNGRFGKVFKGFNKKNGEDIAVKVINRSSLKGKFTELLNNEIKVLKSCNNNNIIKLIDLKKTANNIYLILEFCNEGDLAKFLKIKGRLSQNEATDIFIQIINAFKTINKNNIMHRDLKLDNILKHNGIVKIADFGFSKLLGDQDWANTLLGSPLNMAPEILEEKNYNNKADIWSIGVCFYELLHGHPPYNGKSLLDLIKNIKTKNLVFNPKIKINDITKDVLRRMLIIDPEKRIEWKDLFNHKINFMLVEDIKYSLEETINKNNLINNITKFYLENNKIFNHVNEIKKKKELNNYVYNIIKNNNINFNFNGKILNYNNKREKGDIKVVENLNKIIENNDKEVLNKELTIREKKIKIFKLITDKVLKKRNIYSWIAFNAINLLNYNCEFKDLVCLLLFKKQLFLIIEMRNILIAKVNNEFDFWEDYQQTFDYKELLELVNNEHDFFNIFIIFFNDLNKKKHIDLNNNDFKEILFVNSQNDIDNLFNKLIKPFIKNIVNNFINESNKQLLVYLLQILEYPEIKNNFDENLDNKFNFNLYYEKNEMLDYEELLEIISKKL